MKDIVTFETAVRLREAGFPQPPLEAGQVWHYYRQKSLIITFAYSTGQIDFATIGGITKSLVELPDHCVFAPTTTDILRELPGCTLAIENLYKEMEIVGVYYDVWKTGRLLADHANPAEAAAEAWIKLNDKK